MTITVANQGNRVSSHPEVQHHNWLVHRITTNALRQELRRYATGVLVDVGCGAKPCSALTKGLVAKHIGVDYPGTAHDSSSIDVFASAYDTTLPGVSADTVLCTVVLEHLERPQEALQEAYRILKPGGHLILTVPLFWHLHEEPRDFYRYTKFGLSYLLETVGFEIVEIKPLAGFIVTFAQEMCYFIETFRRPILKYPIRFAQFFLQWGAYKLFRLGRDRDDRFTWAYLAVAKKAAL